MKTLFFSVSKDVACIQNNNCKFITQCTIHNSPLAIFCCKDGLAIFWKLPREAEKLRVT